MKHKEQHLQLHGAAAEALLFELDAHHLRMRGLLRAFNQPSEDKDADAAYPLFSPPVPSADREEASLPSPEPEPPEEVEVDPTALVPAGVPSWVRRRMAACRRASLEKQNGAVSDEAGQQNLLQVRAHAPTVQNLHLKDSSAGFDKDSSDKSSTDGERSACDVGRDLREAAREADPAEAVVALAAPGRPEPLEMSASLACDAPQSARSSRRGSCPRYDSVSPRAVPSCPKRPSRSTAASSDSETTSSEDGPSNESTDFPAFHNRSSKNSMQETAIFRRLSAVGILFAGDEGDEGAGVPTARSRAREFVASIAFDTLMAVVVITNAVTIGLQVDHAGVHVGEDPPQLYENIETVFCVVFSLELAIRIYALRAEFFRTFGWNYFDAALVALQVTEEVFKAMGRTTGSSSVARNVKVMKVWRLLRLFRSMRLIRIVRVVDEFSKLVYLVVCSFWSFLWTMLLLLILTYITGTFITQIVADHGDRTPPDVESELRGHFGRLGSTVFVLFESILGGVDWKDLVDPLFHISVALPLLFVLYIAFVVLVLLNLVTGVFVETAQRKRDHDTQDELQQKLKQALRKAGLRLDALISPFEFHALLAQEEMVAYLKGHNMDEASMMSVFKLLFDKHRGRITPQEFLTFCLRLEGAGATIELGKMHLQTSNELQEMLVQRSRDRADDKKAMQRFLSQGAMERKQLKIFCEELRQMQLHSIQNSQQLRDLVRHGTKESEACCMLHGEVCESIRAHVAELRELHHELVQERSHRDCNVSQLAVPPLGGMGGPTVSLVSGGSNISCDKVSLRRETCRATPCPVKRQAALRGTEEVGAEAPG